MAWFMLKNGFYWAGKVKDLCTALTLHTSYNKITVKEFIHKNLH